MGSDFLLLPPGTDLDLAVVTERFAVLGEGSVADDEMIGDTFPFASDAVKPIISNLLLNYSTIE